MRKRTGDELTAANPPLSDAEIMRLARALARQVAREDYEAELARLRAGALSTKPARMLLPKEVAERWRMSERTIRNMVGSGELPGARIGGKLLRIRIAAKIAVSAQSTCGFADRGGAPK